LKRWLAVRLLAVLFLAWLPTAQAQWSELSFVDPGLRWRTLETAAFAVHFAERHRDQARTVAGAAERVLPRITALLRWRRHLHQFPETGFREHRTADYVASVLTALGLEVHRGIGGTGVVANLRAGSGGGAIGLRADMDALAMAEQAPGRPYASQNPGCMHGCGHDGHMAMLLGAAQTLARVYRIPELSGEGYYMAFGNLTPDATVEKFRRALEAVKHSGRYEQLQRQWK